MKNIIITVLLSCLSLGSNYAQKAETSANEKSTHISINNNRSSLHIKNNDMQINVDGEVEIGDDDKSISSLSPNSKISYRYKKQRLDIEADNDGNPSYRINGEKVQTLSASDIQLVEECVRIMIGSGVGAEGRAKRILDKEGADGIWEEMENLKNDYTKKIYLSTLLSQQLSTAQMVSFLNQTNQYLSSDYYKSELMRSVMAPYIEKPETFAAYLNAVQNIGSDYYQYTTIQRLLGQSLNDKQFHDVLSVTTAIESDYYQTEVLKSLLNSNDLKNQRVKAVTQAVFNLSSDYYKAEIFKQMAAKDISNEKDWQEIIKNVSHIKSAHYQAEVLTLIIKRMPNNDNMKQAVREAANNMQSDSYYRKVMRAL